MKIIIEREHLSRVMSHAVGIIERKQTVLVLGCVLFNVKKSGASVTSTNMDITVVDTVVCDVLEEGACCIGAHLLFDITKKIPDGQQIIIEHSGAENTVNVSSGKSNFSINCVDPSEFPPIPSDDYPISFEMDSEIFEEAVEISKVAMLHDNSRFHLNGIHVHYENDLGINKINFVATDLYRIACVSVPAPREASSVSPIIISKKAVSEMLKLINDTDAKIIKIKASNSRISIELGNETVNTKFSSRLVSGNFPEYKAALSVSNDKILIVDTKALISAIDRVRTVVVDITNSVKLSIHDDKLIISGVSRELGRAVEEVEATFNVPGQMEICFNSKYLLDLLYQIKTDEVKFSLAESNSSAIINPVIVGSTLKKCDCTFAIMPIEIINS